MLINNFKSWICKSFNPYTWQNAKGYMFTICYGIITTPAFACIPTFVTFLMPENLYLFAQLHWMFAFCNTVDWIARWQLEGNKKFRKATTPLIDKNLESIKKCLGVQKSTFIAEVWIWCCSTRALWHTLTSAEKVILLVATDYNTSKKDKCCKKRNYHAFSPELMVSDTNKGRRNVSLLIEK